MSKKTINFNNPRFGALDITRELEIYYSWSTEQCEEAAISAISAETSGRGWLWSVGTEGSMHFCRGFSSTRDGAEAEQEACYDRLLSRNPACGDFSTRLWRESFPQRNERLFNRALEIIHAG